MKIKFSLFLLMTFTMSLAQKQAYVWHFGNGNGLDFSTGVPIQISGSQRANEGCASYCDKYGNLQFYTNGGGRDTTVSPGESPGVIWNRNNNVMYDMAGVEGGGFSAQQSSVIIEAPGEDSTYYLFTMEEIQWDDGATAATIASQPGGRGLSYFKVDMRLNSALGGVVLADQRVFTPSYEGLCAVRHANGQDYWIIISQDTLGLGVYRVTPAGVTLAGIYSDLSSTTGSYQQYPSVIKGAPDGQHLMATFMGQGGIYQSHYLLDFNNTTGQITGPQIIDSAPTNALNISTSYEFSPNSRYLYFTTVDSFSTFPLSQKILRYDALAPNITASKTVIGTYNVLAIYFGLQLAPDGKIYFVQSGTGQSTAHRINCPNTQNVSVELNLFSFASSFQNFPNYPAWLFENYDSTFVSLGPDTITLCDVGGSYTLNAFNPGANYLWSTGETTQTITVTAPGTYSVTVNGACGIGTDQIVITPCENCNTTNTSFNATACVNYTAPWGTVYSQTGIYKDTLITTAGCDSIIEVNLTITGLPTLTASSVSGTCGQPNGTATATATGGAGNYAYSWSNGATGNFISGLSSGSYSVVATDQNGCTSTSQVIVNTTPAAGITLTASDTILGLNESAELEVIGGNTYNWAPSTGLSCDDCPSVVASPSSSTTYTVTGIDTSGCPYLRVINVLVDIVCNELFVPNIFSPNGIGNAENEKLCVYSNCVKSMNLGIYNRWGELIYSTDDQTACWDGTYKGEPLMTGVYSYRLFVEQFDGEKIEKSGNISLTR